MARFDSYANKTKPDADDTVLIHSVNDNPDVLKQLKVKAVLEEYDGTALGTTSQTLQGAIAELVRLVADASIARFS